MYGVWSDAFAPPNIRFRDLVLSYMAERLDSSRASPLSLFEQPATKFFQQHARSVVTEVPP